MLLSRYLWLLLCYAQYARSTLVEDYEQLVTEFLPPQHDQTEYLPVQLGEDSSSGCICRGNEDLKQIACFGNYLCKKFPKVPVRSESLKVRTSAILQIRKGEIDYLYYLDILQVEGNYQLQYLEPGLFRNLSNLQQLSISYNVGLHSLAEDIFEGLTNLRNLTLVNNGFVSISQLTPAFRPNILPSLRSLDVSQNSLETIPEDAFQPMKGTPLKRLVIRLCRLDYIHPESFLPLKSLEELFVGENDLSSILIGNFLTKMSSEGINLTQLDLSGMGFRKQVPRNLLDIIAQTTIKRLNLAQNQFEIISNDDFPVMINIEVLDLRKVLALFIGPYAFEPAKFPNLKALLLGGNNLAGIHNSHLSNQLILLDLSLNQGTSESTLYFEIARDTFDQSKELKILNLSFNRIKSIFDYTFKGLEKLKILNIENGTLYRIGEGTFKPLRHLQYLNIASNPLTLSQNLSGAQFEGLNELKTLILKNCGIRYFNDDDNIFEMMPNISNLILSNNLLYYVTAETLKPMKFLEVLDLSQNLLVAWWAPLFLAAGVTPHKLYLADNKISHFSQSMIQDINYLLEKRDNSSLEIDFMNNIFICDCSSMYKTYLWLEVNGSSIIRQYFAQSKFQCSSPDMWEDRRVSEYLSSVKNLRCMMYEKISSIMILVWSTPSVVTIVLLITFILLIYKYKIYLKYWLFLGKLALGRKFVGKSLQEAHIERKVYKYDAFVSYCHEDRDFILELICHLEDSPPYFKLCLYERDFEVGSFISESAVSCINESKYVILIISNSFAKSQWCRWETQLAEYHRLFREDGTVFDPLLLIKIGEVENKHLTSTLKYLLKTKIYLAWDEQNPNEFWKKLKTVLSKQL